MQEHMHAYMPLQQQLNYNNRTVVFSKWSMLRCYYWDSLQ
jgi:hypothetical protein